MFPRAEVGGWWVGEASDEATRLGTGHAPPPRLPGGPGVLTWAPGRPGAGPGRIPAVSPPSKEALLLPGVKAQQVLAPRILLRGDEPSPKGGRSLTSSYRVL